MKLYEDFTPLCGGKSTENDNFQKKHAGIDKKVTIKFHWPYHTKNLHGTIREIMVLHHSADYPTCLDVNKQYRLRVMLDLLIR